MHAIALHDGNNPKLAWSADLSGAAFVKITAVYGHIDENGLFVRKFK